MAVSIHGVKRHLAVSFEAEIGMIFEMLGGDDS